MDLRITDEEVERTLTARDFVHSCDEAFRLYATGEMTNPPRSETVTREGAVDVFRLDLPGDWKGRYRGRKVIVERSDVGTGRLGGREATVELTDLATGRRVVLDAEVITNMRTGAAGALGAKYFGPERVRSVAILGTGRISRALALCVDTAVRPAQIRATSRSGTNRRAFQDGVGPLIDADLVLAESIESCIDGADAVLTAVPTPQPVLSAGSIKEGVVLGVIAGDPRTKQLDVDLLCSRPVVVDLLDQARRSGDFVAAGQAGRGDDIRLVREDGGRQMSIGDAALGRLGALRGKGPIVYLTGMAIQDIHAAATVCERRAETRDTNG